MAHLIGNVSLNKSVYSLYDIAKFEHISKERIDKLMAACLSRATSAAPVKTAAGIQAFFNNIASVDRTINTFYTHSRLYPFAGAIRLAMERVFNGKRDMYYAMFYIPKAIYEKYKKTGVEYNAEAAPNMGEEGLPSCSVPKRRITLPDIAMLTQFEKILKKLDIKLSEGILLAVSEYMQKHSDIFGDIKEEKCDESLVRENRMSLIQAYISPETVTAVYKALQRANQECIVKIKFSEFVDAALREKLDRLPVKYTNPELYREQLEIAKAEKEFLEKGGG